MHRDPPPLTPESLYPRRLAARALALVLEQLGLSDVSRKFNPDDPTQVLPGAEFGEFRFYEDTGRLGHRAIAHVYLDGDRVRVVVESVIEIIRRNHRRDFHPEEIGISPTPARPDIDVEADLGSIADASDVMRTAPQRRLIRRRAYAAPRAIHAWSALRSGAKK
jgi:hypothetical protein